jgi:hypothetical protein
LDKSISAARYREIVKKADGLLDDYRRQCEEGRNRPLSEMELIPIDVEAIARRCGLEIEVVEKFYSSQPIRGSLNSGVVTVPRASVGLGTRRFSIAHELGHQVLQGSGTYLRVERRPGQMHQHADNREELEAEAFAALLLMPEGAVRRHFSARFGRPIGRAECDDKFAFLFSRGRLTVSMLRQTELRKFANMVASAIGFGPNSFPSLSDAFKVSSSAMVRRLITLQLVA